jgi:2-polyprenyl-3-methyl-5-hydroxy-6-metoxy-1,4-benzoquinol methylase
MTVCDEKTGKPAFDYAGHERRLRAALEAAHASFFDPDSGRLKKEYSHTLTECPVCSGVRLRPFMEKDGFLFERCAFCGMVFLNPRLTDEATYAFYNSKWISIYNEGKFHGASATIEADRLENKYLLSMLAGDTAGDMAGKRLLEIGPGGEGTLLHEALALGCEVTGIELSRDNCDSLAQRFGASITLLNTTLEKAALPGDYYDYVVMRDVLEHLPHPLCILHEIFRIIKCDGGGRLLIQVPNIDGLIYAVAQAKHTVVFGFEHPNYWSPKSLGHALHRSGFNMARVEHESNDFTLRDICDYLWGEATFTTVFPPPRRTFARFAYKRVSRLIENRYMEKIGNYLPFLADRIFRRGSVIKVLAKKEPPAHPQQTGAFHA